MPNQLKKAVQNTIKKVAKIFPQPRYAKLNALKFGIALGIVCGLSLLLLSVYAMLSSQGLAWIALSGDFYYGYSATPLGAFLGLLYGFIDGFIGGFVFAWIYNRLV